MIYRISRCLVYFYTDFKGCKSTNKTTAFAMEQQLLLGNK